jgi:single-stranded DNA-binding protein
VIVWRDQAEHAAQSLAKGSRVVVVGRLQQRSWTRKDGRAFYQTRLMCVCVCVIRDASANSGDGRAAAVVAQKPPR